MSLSAGSQCHPQLHGCWSQAQGPSCNREYCRYTHPSAHSEVETSHTLLGGKGLAAVEHFLGFAESVSVLS